MHKVLECARQGALLWNLVYPLQNKSGALYRIFNAEYCRHLLCERRFARAKIAGETYHERACVYLFGELGDKALGERVGFLEGIVSLYSSPYGPSSPYSRPTLSPV